MRVAIIDPLRPDTVTYGESDMKRFDDIYVKVERDGATDKSLAMQLTPRVYVWPADNAVMVQASFKDLAQQKKEFDQRQWNETIRIQRELGGPR